MLHMHGELQSALCAACGNAVKWEGDMPLGSVCGDCGAPKLRPDIVFFGEMPYEMERIDQALAKADLFVSVGTSGAVYPAAGFVQTARYHGARTLELNLDPSAGSIYFDESRMGPAGELVPERSEEHTSELQSLMRTSYAVFCLKKKKIINNAHAIYIISHKNKENKHTIMRMKYIK